ncbi:MAG: Rrf2 family transcriptional regulator [Erysipelotrichaceae bacterium]|nr:Rrf2 family transcriptional regulator [Erysipelotrichaceae bacterium]
MTSDFNIAVYALVHLSGKRESLASSDELAKTINTHPVRIRRVMIKLKEAGMITTKAGVTGGYSLNESPDTITLSQVAKALSDDYIHVTWHSGEINQTDAQRQGVQNILDDIFVKLNQTCDEVLSQITIASITTKLEDSSL